MAQVIRDRAPLVGLYRPNVRGPSDQSDHTLFISTYISTRIKLTHWRLFKEWKGGVATWQSEFVCFVTISWSRVCHFRNTCRARVWQLYPSFKELTLVSTSTCPKNIHQMVYFGLRKHLDLSTLLILLLYTARIHRTSRSLERQNEPFGLLSVAPGMNSTRTFKKNIIVLSSWRRPGHSERLVPRSVGEMCEYGGFWPLRTSGP